MAAPVATRTVSSSGTAVSITLSTLLVDGADTLLMVTAGAGDQTLSARQVTTCTHNSDACTKKWEADDGIFDNSQGWTRLAPDAGTFDVVVTWGSGGAQQLRGVGATLVNGVNQGDGAATFGTAVTGANTNTANTIAVGSAVDELVISGTATDDETGLTAGQTQLWQTVGVGSDCTMAGQRAAGAASVTMAWTQDIVNWASGGISIKSSAAALALDQEGFRWRNDDGSESTATWKAAQDVNASIAPDATARLRMVINATNDPPSAQYKLQYRKTGATGWRDIDKDG